MKRLFSLLIIATITTWFFFYTQKGDVIKNTALTYIIPVSNINETGVTILSRIKPPEGYKRVIGKTGSFQRYIQEYSLLKYGIR